MSKSGIVNVRMVITEEKIISNIDKVQKLINPNNKKKIVQLEEDTYFKDLIESIKTYLIEYPKKKNFPISVYNAAYGLVEFAINQFEENTKKVEELMASEKSLSGMWEGQAKEAFENAFNTDAGKMNQFKAAVDEYYSRLLTIVSQYEQAESKNVSVGTTRTV